jgi:hypothetical protein
VSTFDAVLAFVFGAIGCLVIHAVVRVADGGRVSLRFQRQNERVVSKIHQIVQTKNELMMLEAELAEMLEREPVDRARWFAQLKAVADSLPPVFLSQLRRWGLAEPPPEVVEPAPLKSVRPLPPPEQQGQVIEIDAWTGKTRSQ